MKDRIHAPIVLAYLTIFLFLVSATGKVIAREDGKKVCASMDNRSYTTSNIIHVKDAFYAVDWKGRVLSTSNGQEWSIYRVNEKSKLLLHDIAWNGEYFVVTTNFTNDIYRSLDAKTWQRTIRLDGGVGLPRLRAYEGTFYLLGSYNDNTGPMFYSNDNGLTWKIETAFMSKNVAGGWDVTDLIQVNKEYYYTLESRRMSSAIPKIGPPGWHMVESTSRDREKEKKLRRVTGFLAYGNRRFVVAERNGRRVLTSDDGRTWKEHVLGYYDGEYKRYFADLEWTGKEFFLVGKKGTILRSEKGDSWSRDEVPTDGALSGVASNGEIHIAVGDPPTDCSKSTSVLVSRDGKSWENVSDKIDQAIKAVQADLRQPTRP